MTTFRSEVRRVLVTVVVAVLVLAACNESRPPSKPTAHQTLAADDGGVIGFRVSQPATMYGLVRHALLARASQGARKPLALPQSLPLLVVSVLGLPPLAAGRLAEHGEWLGMLSRTPEGSAAWALAVPLQSGSEFVAELTLGVGAQRRAGARSGWTELEGANVGALGSVCVGVASNMLLFGASCRGVEALAIRLTLEPSLASAPRGIGIALRLLTSRSVLSGVHAVWGSNLGELLSAAMSSAGQEPSAIGQMLALLDARVSAYLGHIESGDVLLEVQGSRVLVEGKFGAMSLPIPIPDRSFCKALAAVPSNTLAWVAGTGDQQEVVGLPDWYSEPGEWERSIESALAFTLGEPTNPAPALSPLAESTRGHWVVGVREGALGRTFWAMLERETPTRALELLVRRPATVAVPAAPRELKGGIPAPGAPTRGSAIGGSATSGSVTIGSVKREGKALEWGVTPWEEGVAVAVGAPLGDEWHAWTQRLRRAPPDFRFRSSSCAGVVGGVVVGSFIELVVVRGREGLELRGLLDVTGQWSTTR